MATLTLCSGLSGWLHLPQASTNWSALALPQILAGECDLEPDPLRTLWAEIATTSGDEPRLDELLRYAASHASSDWLLLIPPHILLTPALLQTLEQLCRASSPKRLVLGRAWHLPQAELAASTPPDELWPLIERHGVLDPPQHISWLLIPRGDLLAAPPQLSCDPAEAAPWLLRCVEQLGWPILDATAAAPALRLGGATGLGGVRPLSAPLPQPSAVVRPHQPGSPQLSLLMAAPEAELERLQEQLLPAPSLPWELIARPVNPADGPGAVAAAWSSALAVARGELAWPMVATPPPLALLPVVLRSFEQPGLELLQLGPIPQPGAVVAPSAWWRLIGGWGDSLLAADAMAQAVQQAMSRGACLHEIPFRPGQPAA
jgi:hypothetical protein